MKNKQPLIMSTNKLNDKNGAFGYARVNLKNNKRFEDFIIEDVIDEIEELTDKTDHYTHHVFIRIIFSLVRFVFRLFSIIFRFLFAACISNPFFRAIYHIFMFLLIISVLFFIVYVFYFSTESTSDNAFNLFNQVISSFSNKTTSNLVSIDSIENSTYKVFIDCLIHNPDGTSVAC